MGATSVGSSMSAILSKFSGDALEYGHIICWSPSDFAHWLGLLGNGAESVNWPARWRLHLSSRRVGYGRNRRYVAVATAFMAKPDRLGNHRLSFAADDRAAPGGACSFYYSRADPDSGCPIRIGRRPAGGRHSFVRIYKL